MAASETLWAVQFSTDGESWVTLIRLDAKDLANSIMRANAGYGSAFGHPYWRVRQADTQSKDFHAVISDD